MSTDGHVSPLRALCDATIFTGEAMVEGYALLVKDQQIVDIVNNKKIPSDARRQSWAKHILVPGYIDTQVNGGANILFNDNPDAENAIAIALAHQKYGTTRILLTCISDTPEKISLAIDAVREAHMKCPSIIGVHIEGPHISIDKRGIHCAAHIRPLTETDIANYKKKSSEIILITLAPENSTPSMVKTLCEQGTIVSIGHTHASAESVNATLAAGATGFTHLFNAMSGPGARSPGAAGVALDNEGSWCGLIVDGHHVSREMVRVAIRAKATGKIMLVSDAMPPAADPYPQAFTLYGEKIQVANGRCVKGDGRLAGSSITLSDAVKNCIQFGIDIDEALRMASTYPAAFLGIDNRLGKLLPAYEADIIALDYNFNPRNVWVCGEEMTTLSNEASSSNP